jgi:hypothetical protein
MSLSSDFAAARHKSSGLLHDAAEHHPVMMTMATLGGLVTALMLVTRLFMS